MSTIKGKQYKFDKSVQKEINNLVKLDNWHGLIALAKNYFFIFMSIVITCHVTWYFYPLAVLVIGARQRALATLLHEAAHRTLAKNKYLNFTLGSFFSGFLVFQKFTTYQRSHVYFHHGHFGNPSLDPDYQFHICEGLYCENINPRSFVIKNIVLPLMLSKVPTYVKSLIEYRFLGKEGNKSENIAIVIYIGVIVISSILFNFWDKIILFWLVPYFTFFQVIGWFIELSEHYPMVRDLDVNLYTARNRKSHWIEAFFTSIHNENYHLVHHLNPYIPFWNLPKAHEIYLQDTNYAIFDQSIGGIFISSSKTPSILEGIVNQIRCMSCKV